ncbi:hypothetical protein [Sphingobium sp. EM0848]|uniref:hypothetical protein n=1 Tax=Sphingobium sp. EM0848 TaxID=2743473 RepID=UPI00159C0650|nr:hypothetical protein [Sphingobium sp. EM0848]
MSEDARNSINLWLGGLAFFGLFWAGLHFRALEWIPNWLLWPLVGLAALGNLTRLAWGLWKRHASITNGS